MGRATKKHILARALVAASMVGAVTGSFAALPGLRTIVVDSRGKIVGELVAPGVVSLQLKPGGELVKIGLTRRGFADNGALRFEYASKDCSGQAFMAFPGLVRTAYLDPTGQDTIVYPKEPFRVRQARSYRTATGECFGVFRDVPRLAGAIGSADLRAQGFVQPFSVKSR